VYALSLGHNVTIAAAERAGSTWLGVLLSLNATRNLRSQPPGYDEKHKRKTKEGSESRNSILGDRAEECAKEKMSDEKRQAQRERGAEGLGELIISAV